MSEEPAPELPPTIPVEAQPSVSGGTGPEPSASKPVRIIVGEAESMQYVIQAAVKDSRVRHPEFLSGVADLIFQWKAVMADKRTRMPEHVLWKRIYHGLTCEIPQLGPETAGLVPDKDMDEQGWRLLRVFTGQTWTPELLGLATDTVYHFLMDVAPYDVSHVALKTSRFMEEEEVEPVKQPPENGPAETNEKKVNDKEPIKQEQKQEEKEGSPAKNNDAKAEQEIKKEERPPSPVEVDPKEKGKAPVEQQQQDTAQIPNESAYQEFMQRGTALMRRITGEQAMMDVVQDLVVYMAQVVSESDRPPGQMTVSTAAICDTLKALAKDRSEHVQGLIGALARMNVPEKTRTRIIQSWEDLRKECGYHAETEAMLWDVEVRSRPVSSAAPRMAEEWTPRMQDLSNAILAEVVGIIKANPESTAWAIYHERVIFEPYSGGFSPILVDKARQLAKEILWDSERHIPAFHTEYWNDIGLVVPKLCEKLGPLYMGKLDIVGPNYDVTLENVYVKLDKAFPRSVQARRDGTVHHEQTAELPQPEETWDNQELLPASMERMTYAWEDIELSVETNYLYKKKTGFPVWTDNGNASATAKKIRLVLTVSSFRDKPIVVEKTQCTIGSLKIRFHESQHSFLNFILRGMFESKIRQTVCKAAAQMTANMISQMDRVIVT